MSLNGNIKSASDSITQMIMDSPKVAQIIPWGTAAVAKIAESATRLEILSEIQAIISVMAAIIGIAISSVVFYHWLIKVDIAKMDRKAAQLKIKELEDANP